MTSPSPSGLPPRQATYLETDEDVSRAMRDRLLQSAAAGLPPLAAPPAAPLLAQAPVARQIVPQPIATHAPSPIPLSSVPGTTETVRGRSQAQPYRPLMRPPTPILTVFDDGRPDGEQIRLRGGRFVIGRTEGHLKLPNDQQISSRHAEITLGEVNGRRQWLITDLSSTNGLYVRVARAALADRAEFLVGAGYFRLDFPSSGTAATLDHAPAGMRRNITLAPGEPHAPLGGPKLVELVRGAVHAQWSLTRGEYRIGSDPACAVPRTNDPFCEPEHARLFSEGNVWFIENHQSFNGVWVRVPQIVAEGTVYFQIGEQRFRLQVD